MQMVFLFYCILQIEKKNLFTLCFLLKNSVFHGKIKQKEKSSFLVKLIDLLSILFSLGLHANAISLCPLAAKIMNKHNSFANETFLIYLTRTGNDHFENSALLSLIFILQQNMCKAGSAKMLNQLKKNTNAQCSWTEQMIQRRQNKKQQNGHVCINLHLSLAKWD